LAAGLHPDPLGDLTALPVPLAALGEKGERKKWEWRVEGGENEREEGRGRRLGREEGK